MKIVIVLLLLSAACVRPPAAPSDWISRGPAPEGWEVVVEVAAERLPALPPGGYIVWIEGPIACETAALDSAGCTYPTIHPQIGVACFHVSEGRCLDNVETLALGHELLHVAGRWRQDAAFYALLDEINAEAARRLGR